jgi:purine nucleoside phosphorylase
VGKRLPQHLNVVEAAQAAGIERIVSTLELGWVVHKYTVMRNTVR